MAVSCFSLPPSIPLKITHAILKFLEMEICCQLNVDLLAQPFDVDKKQVFRNKLFNTESETLF